MKLAVTVPEAAILVSVGRNTAYQLVKSGQWKTVRVGRTILVPVAELERWLADQATSGNGDTA